MASLSDDDVISSCSDSSSIISIPNDRLKIKFEIVDTNIVNETFGRKFVVFTLMVIETTKLDTDETIIEARYADFELLHKTLVNELPNIMKRVPFPKKKYFGLSLKETVIEERSRSIEKYLQYIYHQDGVKHSKAFREFFFERNFHTATEHLISMEYESSRDLYYLTWRLQRKLEDLNKFIIPTMCGLVESYRNLKDHKGVNNVGTECLDIMEYDISSSYLIPLLHYVIEARKRLEINCDWLKEKFKECKINSVYDSESIATLQELLAKKL